METYGNGDWWTTGLVGAVRGDEAAREKDRRMILPANRLSSLEYLPKSWRYLGYVTSKIRCEQFTFLAITRPNKP